MVPQKAVKLIFVAVKMVRKQNFQNDFVYNSESIEFAV